jgi:outer membrane protein OmpA-like peptidoglycan-associated protein
MRQRQAILSVMMGILIFWGSLDGWAATLPRRERANRCPEITDVMLSDTEIHSGEHVRIALTASDPDEDIVYYVWTVPAGTLTGQASQVVWMAPKCTDIGQASMTYEILVEAGDGRCIVKQTIPVTVKCEVQPPPSPQPEAVLRFSSGQIGVDETAQAQLDDVAARLKQFPDQGLRIEGHTDSTGDAATNEQIGLKRAKRAKAYLVEHHGIVPERITTVSYGASRPIASNDTPEGRTRNRRVEIYRTQ